MYMYIYIYIFYVRSSGLSVEIKVRDMLQALFHRPTEGVR